MTHARLPLGALGAGIFLIIVSMIWPWLFGGQAVWTDEDAQVLAAAAADLHRASENVQGEPAGLAAAEGRLAESEERLEAARNRGKTTASLLRWLGVALGLAGGIGFVALRK